MTQGKLTVIVACLVLVSLIMPSVIGAQVTPDPAGPVEYGPTITTYREKLYACYSLVRQMIDEYNRQSAIAAGNMGKYEGKFRTYVQDEWQPRIVELLSEYTRLKRAIREETYTVKDWQVISGYNGEDLADVSLALWGNKTEERSKSTDGVTTLLTELWAISLDDMRDSQGYDPYEDFYNDYTEDEEFDDITITSGAPYKISYTNWAARLEWGWVYDDKGTDHFDGDFEHLIETEAITGTFHAAYLVVWQLNNVDGADPCDIYLANEEALYTWQVWSSTGTPTWYLREVKDQSVAQDSMVDWELDTLYYCTIERDDDYGTYGRVTMYICTVAHYGEGGSNLEDTLQIDLQIQEDYQYVYGVASMDTTPSGSYDWDGYTQNLDLQEGAPSQVGYSFGYIIGG